MALGTILFFAAYTHYATILDKQLSNQSLRMPAGIYAAPRRISTGEQINREALIERLVRAGYQENEQNNEFAAGSFRLQNDGVEIHTNKFYQNSDLPESIYVHVKDNGIISILQGESLGRINSIQLPAEMLTADFNTKK